MIETERHNSSRKLYLPRIIQNGTTNELTDRNTMVSNNRN